MKLYALVLVGSVTLGACGGSSGDGDNGHEGGSSPADVATAQELLAQLHSANYRTFARAPGWPSRRSGTTQHHGAYLDVYVNSALEAAVTANGTAPWPIGSIIVKDGWGDAAGTQAFMLSAARKDAQGVWFGAEYSPSGAVLSAGHNFAECQGCHGPAKDFTLSF
jgi:hypothetical protein